MKKAFYSALLVLLVASLAALAVATALVPAEPVVPLPARTLAPPIPAG